MQLQPHEVQRAIKRWVDECEEAGDLILTTTEFTDPDLSEFTMILQRVGEHEAVRVTCVYEEVENAAG